MISPIATKQIIESKIFIPLGTTALWSTYIDSSTDNYGDDITGNTFNTATDLTVVPSEYANTTQNFFQFGDLQKGEQDFVIRPLTDIHIKDKIVYGNKSYMVKELKEYILGDTSILIAIRCVEFI